MHKLVLSGSIVCAVLGSVHTDCTAHARLITADFTHNLVVFFGQLSAVLTTSDQPPHPHRCLLLPLLSDIFAVSWYLSNQADGVRSRDKCYGDPGGCVAMMRIACTLSFWVPL